MDSKMSKSQEQSEQQDEKLEATAGRLDALGKNRSLRGKVVRWAAVAASVVGISIGIGMPAQALHRVTPDDNCYSLWGSVRDFFQIEQGRSAPPFFRPTMCFASAGEQKVLIADVRRLRSGNNAGFVITNKGNFHFRKNQMIDFMKNSRTKGTVTILQIKID